jgi:hypothetical protein
LNPRCVKAMLLLDRSASGLGDAERLELEAHLAECTRCSEQATFVRRMVDSAKSVDFALEPLARARVIREALRTSTPGEAPIARREPWRAWPFVAAAAVAILAGAWLVRDRSGGPPSSGVTEIARKSPVPPTPVAAPSNQVPREETASVDAPVGTRLELGGAQIAAMTASKLAWRSMDSTLELRSGAIRVDVTPGRGATFRVRTKRFAVEVIGTSFEVDENGVRVLEGRVRIAHSGDGSLLATLSAGQNWWLSSSVENDASAPTDRAAEISQARRHLAARQVISARSALKRLLELPLAPGQRAEAKSLLAECSLVEGDAAKAARLYAEVAAQNPGSLAGETASFAQARAELRAGDRDAARGSFERYLARHPNGRFSKEALRHLEDLRRSNDKK